MAQPSAQVSSSSIALLRKEYITLVNQSNQIFAGLRDLPLGNNAANSRFFVAAFDVFTKLWKFQQENRAFLSRKDGFSLKRWEIGDLASKIGQLYYQAWLRNTESLYLVNCAQFYDSIRTRKYFDELEISGNPTLITKQLRYMARYIVVALLLNRIHVASGLRVELSVLVKEAEQSMEPPERREWRGYLRQVLQFVHVLTELAPCVITAPPAKATTLALPIPGAAVVAPSTASLAAAPLPRAPPSLGSDAPPPEIGSGAAPIPHRQKAAAAAAAAAAAPASAPSAAAPNSSAGVPLAWSVLEAQQQCIASHLVEVHNMKVKKYRALMRHLLQTQAAQLPGTPGEEAVVVTGGVDLTLPTGGDAVRAEAPIRLSEFTLDMFRMVQSLEFALVPLVGLPQLNVRSSSSAAPAQGGPQAQLKAPLSTPPRSPSASHASASPISSPPPPLAATPGGPAASPLAASKDKDIPPQPSSPGPRQPPPPPPRKTLMSSPTAAQLVQALGTIGADLSDHRALLFYVTGEPADCMARGDGGILLRDLALAGASAPGSPGDDDDGGDDLDGSVLSAAATSPALTATAAPAPPPPMAAPAPLLIAPVASRGFAPVPAKGAVRRPQPQLPMTEIPEEREAASPSEAELPDMSDEEPPRDGAHGVAPGPGFAAPVPVRQSGPATLGHGLDWRAGPGAPDDDNDDVPTRTSGPGPVRPSAVTGVQGPLRPTPSASGRASPPPVLRGAHSGPTGGASASSEDDGPSAEEDFDEPPRTGAPAPLATARRHRHRTSTVVAVPAVASLPPQRQRCFSDAPPLSPATAAAAAGAASPGMSQAAAAAAAAPVPHPAPPIAPEVQCLWPADLVPFARRPLFVIVDSSVSHAWGRLVAVATEQHRAMQRVLMASAPGPAQMQALMMKPAHLPQLAVFASPVAVPPAPAPRGKPADDTLSFSEWFTNIAPRVGRLYTAFMHSPLMALCALCGVRGPSCAKGSCVCPCVACRAAPSPVVLPLNPSSAFNMGPGGVAVHSAAHYRLHAHMHTSEAQQHQCEMDSMASCQRRIQAVFDTLCREVFFNAALLVRSLPAGPALSGSPLAGPVLSPGAARPGAAEGGLAWDSLAVFQHFAEDEYLRQFMLRHWFCHVVLRHHVRWGGRLADLSPVERARCMPQVFPAWPAEVLEHTEPMNELVRALAAELGVTDQFEF